MMIDFTNVSSGSNASLPVNVWLNATLHHITEKTSKTGLNMLAVDALVTYNSDERWVPISLMLPVSMQSRQLSEGQQKACEIGGGLIKTILVSAGLPLQFNSWAVLENAAVSVMLTTDTYNGQEFYRVKKFGRKISQGSAETDQFPF